MSRGPGRIEQAIRNSFEADADQAPTTEELCEVAYPGVNRIEKKHRVAVLRAAHKVCKAMLGWGWSRTEALGGTSVFWNCYSVSSYALMRIKTGDVGPYVYRSNDARIVNWKLDAAGAKDLLVPGGRYHSHVVEGGDWHRHVRLWTIERDKDTSAEAIAFKAESERKDERLRALLGISRPPG